MRFKPRQGLYLHLTYFQPRITKRRVYVLFFWLILAENEFYNHKIIQNGTERKKTQKVDRF
jgi:hypothetical protein